MYLNIYIDSEFISQEQTSCFRCYLRQPKPVWLKVASS